MKQDQQGEQKEGGQNDSRASEKVILGRITGVYGVKGWLKVFSYTDPMESIVDYSTWYLRPENSLNNRNRSPWKKVELIAGKRHAKTVIAKLEQCNDRDEAQAYIGSEIAIEPAQLEQLRGKNEFYWHELTGLRVINQQGIELGVVTSLMETGANDVLVVASKEETENEADNNEAREQLIPWVLQQTILSVDLKQGVIEVDWDPDF